MDNHTAKPASPQQGISTKATIVERYSYDVFGKPTIRGPSDETRASSAVGNRYMFTGREYDWETGNYYYRARYYRPVIGRFLQTDPIRYTGGLNLYTYAENNPINQIDPWGEASIGSAPLYYRPFRWGGQYLYGDSRYSQHWQILYDDSTSSGYFGGNPPVFGQDTHRTNQQYTPFMNNLDDDLLRQAESIVQQRWSQEGQRYNFISHSCQTYVLQVLQEYKRLQQEQQLEKDYQQALKDRSEQEQILKELNESEKQCPTN